MFEVIKGNKTGNDRVTLHMHGESETFDSFVVVGNKPNGEVIFAHNTDVLTVGQAIQMMKLLFAEMFVQLTEEDKAEVKSILKTLEVLP